MYRFSRGTLPTLILLAFLVQCSPDNPTPGPAPARLTFEGFLTTLQAAAADNDLPALAGLVRIPFTVEDEVDETLAVSSRDELSGVLVSLLEADVGLYENEIPFRVYIQTVAPDDIDSAEDEVFLGNLVAQRVDGQWLIVRGYLNEGAIACLLERLPCP